MESAPTWLFQTPHPPKGHPRKLHIGVDQATGEILAAVLTTNDVADSAVLPDLLGQIDEPLAQMSGDGGYDKGSCYEALRRRQTQQATDAVLRVTIPPRHGARIWQHGNRKVERLARDENLRRIVGCCRIMRSTTWS